MTDGWLDRLKAERDEVNERLCKLEGFMYSPEYAGLPSPDKFLLTIQADVMHAYEEILCARIRRAEVSE